MVTACSCCWLVAKDFNNRVKWGKLALNFDIPQMKSLQLQGAKSQPPDLGLCPWTPLGAQPPDHHYLLALHAHHTAPNHQSWIRPCITWH